MVKIQDLWSSKSHKVVKSLKRHNSQAIKDTHMTTLKTPGEGNGCPLRYSDLENSTGWIYSPRGGKESDTTE